MSDLYNAIMSWEDSDKSYENEPLKEDGENFKDIQEMIMSGAKLTDDEKKTIQNKVYELYEKTNASSAAGNQAAAVVSQKVQSNLEFALKFYEKKNPN